LILEPFLVLQLYFFLITQLTFAQEAERKIIKENIEKAEKIFGLEFTDAERDSMQDALNEQLDNYVNIHK